MGELLCRSHVRKRFLRLSRYPTLTVFPYPAFMKELSGFLAKIGKTDRLRHAPTGFTTPILDDHGLCDQLSLVRPGRLRYPLAKLRGRKPEGALRSNKREE